LVHAAAVGLPEGGVIVGRGGSGKCTTALLSLGSELFYAGDDYVIIGADPAPTVSLYNSAKVNSDHVRNLPHLGPAIRNETKLHLEKALVLVREHWPERIPPRVPGQGDPDAALPDPPETTFKTTTPGALLRAIAPSTIFQLPAGAQDFERLSEFIKKVPLYVLEAGTELLPGSRK
jgi:hypothetical protein